ncbi:hypothetical protein TrRE_jg4667 [Triparma retinervis]|uniref:Uncharacterized protein n=1 Tax=Triparma retinervis TaxID=2557542 RepID=A0A9W6ZKD9_9STRA|nr:hypothetical protein TrRE_jg4667 [Triparma retinervis]
MGVASSVPVSSSQTCVVVTVNKSCIIQTFPPSPFPEELRVAGVFESDYKKKASSFDGAVNGTLKLAYGYMFVGVIFSVVFGNIGTRLLDMELGIVLTLTYVPIVAALAYLVCKLRTLPTIAENVFEDWRRFGIETKYFMGGKHQPARVGFHLTGEALRRQADIKL